MASVVLQQNLPGFNLTGTNRASLFADTCDVRSVSTSGPSVLANSAQPGQPSVTIGTTVQLSTIEAPNGATVPTAFTDTLSTYTGGGVVANTRTVTLSADPIVAVAASPALALGAFGTSYPAPVPAGGGNAATTQPVVRLPPSLPIGVTDWQNASGLIGQFQSTGALQNISVPGITAGSTIRFYLLGWAAAANIAAGVAYPGLPGAAAAPVITANVGFSVTAENLIYWGYEVLLA
jgi:hypothetical protein